MVANNKIKGTGTDDYGVFTIDGTVFGGDVKFIKYYHEKHIVTYTG